MPKDACTTAHFYPMWGMQWCSMKITGDVRDYAKEHGFGEAIGEGMAN